MPVLSQEGLLRQLSEQGPTETNLDAASATVTEVMSDAESANLPPASQASAPLARARTEANKSVADDDNDGVESAAYNRKEKSLGELCRRFLFLYGTPQRGLLYLDQCTKELGVERRRIYDIINILESFSVIQRCAKNEYQWRGIDKIVHSIEKQIKSCVSLPDCPQSLI